MRLTSSLKSSRRFVGLMITIWFLCQSMIVCAGLLGNGASQNSTTDSMSVVNYMSGVGPSNHHGSHLNDSPHHASSGGEAEQVHDHGSNSKDCCDDHESALSKTASSMFVFFIAAVAFVWLIRLIGAQIRFIYHFKEPPPTFNYPRDHLVFCRFYE